MEKRHWKLRIHDMNCWLFEDLILMYYLFQAQHFFNFISSEIWGDPKRLWEFLALVWNKTFVRKVLYLLQFLNEEFWIFDNLVLLSFCLYSLSFFDLFFLFSFFFFLFSFSFFDFAGFLGIFSSLACVYIKFDNFLNNCFARIIRWINTI